jgi:hypothetical protein
MVAAVVASFEESAGRVMLSITGLDAGLQVLTVTRQSLRPHRSGTASVPYESAVVRAANAIDSYGTTEIVFDYEYDPSDGSTYWLTNYRVTTDLGVDVTTSIQPVPSDVWIKSIQNPYRNMTCTVTSNVSQETFRARRGIFPIVGSDKPVVVTDIHTAGELSLQVLCDDSADAFLVKTLLCNGDIYFLQAPATTTLPAITGPIYFSAGDVTISRPGSSEDRLVTVQVTEVAQPSLDVVGVAWTYQTIYDTYASYAAVKAAWSSYQELLIGPPPGEIEV